MSTTVIVVNETGVIEVANLSHEFIYHLSELVEGSRQAVYFLARKGMIDRTNTGRRAIYELTAPVSVIDV